MTVTVTNIVAGPFVATGDEQVIPFDFKVFTPEEVEVVVGSDAVPVDPALYEVESNRTLDGLVAEGGTITLRAGALAAQTGFRAIAKPKATQEMVFTDTGSRLKNINEVADRAALRAIRAQYDGALEGAGAELIEAATLAGAAAGAAAGVGKADRTGENLTPLDGQAFRFALSDRVLRPEDFYQTGDQSWVEAIERMEAAADPGDICRFNARTYDLNRLPGVVLPSGKRGFERQAMNWIGDGAVFMRTGGDPTTDILAFRGETIQLKECRFEGFTARSEVQMTGDSAAIHFKNLCRTNIARVQPGGQDDPTNGGLGFLKHGIWLDEIDEINCSNFVGLCRTGDAVRVNGKAGSGAKAGLKLTHFKVGGSEIGLHIGGAFGGIYTSCADIAVNERGVVIDQAIVNEYNREVFFDALVSVDANNLVGILVDQPDDARLFLNLGGMWVASTQNGPGVHIKNAINSRVLADAYLYQNAQDGLLLEAPKAYVGGKIMAMGNGYAAEPGGSHPGWYAARAAGATVNGLCVEVSGFSNGSTGSKFIYSEAAPIHQTYALRGQTSKIAAEEITATGINGIRSTYGFRTDVDHYMTRLGTTAGVGGNPAMNYDPYDYETYDRLQNTKYLYIGGAEAHSTVEGGFTRLGTVADGGLHVKWKHITTTTDSSGNVLVAHGVSSAVNRFLVAQVRVGADGAAKTTFNANYDGTNIGVNGTGQNNTKAVVSILYAKNDV